MEAKRKVQTEEAQQYAKDNDIIYMETSAKTSINVEQSFLRMASEIKSRVAVTTSKPTATPAKGQQLSTGKAIGNKKGQGCC